MTFTLTAEEREILRGLTREQLLFLSGLADSPSFPVFIDIVNRFKDIEKDQFFKNTSYDKERLAVDLQFARGEISGQAKLVHIIGGAKPELARRKK